MIHLWRRTRGWIRRFFLRFKGHMPPVVADLPDPEPQDSASADNIFKKCLEARSRADEG